MGLVLSTLYNIGVDSAAFNEAITDIGRDIHQKGGMRATQGAFYIFVVALRIVMDRARKEEREALHVRLVDMRSSLGHLWDGVGEWKA